MWFLEPDNKHLLGRMSTYLGAVEFGRQNSHGRVSDKVMNLLNASDLTSIEN